MSEWRGLGKFHGLPCGKCGNTWRYVNRKRCVHCQQMRYAGKPPKVDESDKALMVELRARHAISLQELAEKFDIPVFWVKRALPANLAGQLRHPHY